MSNRKEILMESEAERNVDLLRAGFETTLADLDDAYAEIESLRIALGQRNLGLSEYEAHEDGWPDEESRARYNRVEARLHVRATAPEAVAKAIRDA